ncbi:MAG: type IV secretory system conjugative DNA transfer family protein [Clostridiaceae bacterium]|jgi:type IV secretory pathway TraG/TraD family ATPase VirD4|nr:type IV secretory system conjugative DNA transfer family protein [Clostridiaceae bacterium]
MKNDDSFAARISAAYIAEYLENSREILYTDLSAADGLKTVYYEDLNKTEIEGYPVASDLADKDGNVYSAEDYKNLSAAKKKECKLRFHYLPYHHELYVGTTGSGKTTGCVEPQLRAISSQKNKPNLFLTDPKGELFDRNVKHLKEQGYKIFVLNFKEPMRSDRWNPFFELYTDAMKLSETGQDVKFHAGKVKKGLITAPPYEAYMDTGYWEYAGRAFANEVACDAYVAFERCTLSAQIDSKISQMAHMMIKVQSSKDPTWEYGAQDLLKGLLNCMLEEATRRKDDFTSDMMTLRTLQRYYLELKVPILAENNNTTLYNHPVLRDKSEKTLALMATALGNAPTTMRSYCGVFDTAIKDWLQGHIFALTSGNTIDLDSDDENPFAIFNITRDYEKSDFIVAGLFIDWVYRMMLEKVEKKGPQRALHFLLDEFGNIPEIRDLENKISTARSRNIWFHLVVQSHKQLDIVYGADRAVVIRDNCNSQIFLGAQNRATKENFSAECGKRFVPTLSAQMNDDDHTLSEVLLIPVSKLDLIRPGEMYIKRIYMPVFRSAYVRSYLAAGMGMFKNFLDGRGLTEETPFCTESFDAPRYTFDFKSRKRKRIDDFFD